MAYWLMKSEPFVWSWDQQVERKIAPWTDVRNYQARNNMKAMKRGDQAFFYHSTKGLEIVGIMEIVKEHYPDPKDERFVLVDVRATTPFKNPVKLADLKASPALADMAMLRQSRLSVSPVTAAEWKTICKMGGV